jgi:hypothetical protein
MADQPVHTGDSSTQQRAVTAQVTPVRQGGPSNAERVKAQKDWEKAHESGSRKVTADQHLVGEPTDEDYEKARTVGIGDEPELPPGVVRKDEVAAPARNQQG